MYTTQQAQEIGFDVSPLSVTIAGKSYREYDEIMPDHFVEIIAEGHLPTSSQPAVGEVVAMYEKYPDDEIINITMALGLSGKAIGQAQKVILDQILEGKLCNKKEDILLYLEEILVKNSTI
jgi:fatty acid-binding protein DegV